MATVFNQFNSQQDDQQNQSPGQGSNSNLSNPQAPTVGGSQESGVVTPGASAAPTNSGGTSSGRFNNIRKYLTANKDFNAGGGGLAGKIVGNVAGQAQNVQQNVQKAGQAFQQQSQQNINQFNQPNVVDQALADPSQFAQNQDNLAKFTAIRDATYTGPKGLQDLSGDQGLARLQGQSANINDLVQQGQSESGRFNLLKTMYGKPTYTAGQQNLDNLLLQNNRGQLNQLQGLRQTATNTQRTLANTQKTAEQQAAEAQQQAQQIQQSTRQRTNQSVADLQNAINARLPEAQKAQQEAAANFASGLKGGYISPEDLARFAESNPEFKEGMSLYGVDLTPYVQTTGDLRAETVANKDQYGRFGALGQLLGNTANEQTSATLAQFSNPELAGQFESNPMYNLDVNRALGAITANKAKMESDYLPYKKQLDEAEAYLSGSGANPYGGSYQGGLLGQLDRLAAPLREKYSQGQDMWKTNPELAQTLGLPAYVDYSKMSARDILKKDMEDAAKEYQAAVASNSTAQQGGDRTWFNKDLLGKVDKYEAQKKAAENQYKKLQEMFKVNRTLTTDQSKADLSAGLPTALNAVLGLPSGSPTFDNMGAVLPRPTSVR